MTVEHLIGQAMLRINGGHPTSDSDITWADARSYLPMAVNYVLTGQYWAETKQEGEKTINPLLYSIFDLTIASGANCDYYITLPKKMITLSKGRALEVHTTGGKKCYPFVQGDEALEEFYGKLKPSIISYLPEGPYRVKIFNKPPLVNQLRVKYWVAVDDLADTDDILLSSDGDVKVIDLMVAFLTGEKQAPKDYLQDNLDKIQ